MSTTLSTCEILTDGGLAELLRVSTRTILRYSKLPDFPRPLWVGRCRRWPKEEVLAYFREDHGSEAAAHGSND